MAASWARSSRIPLFLLLFVVTVGMSVPAWAGGGGVQLLDPSLANNIVTVTVANDTGDKVVADVTALYHDGEIVHTVVVQVTLNPGMSLPVELRFRTVVGIIDPEVNIIEDPDPVPANVCLAVLWSDT